MHLMNGVCLHAFSISKPAALAKGVRYLYVKVLRQAH